MWVESRISGLSPLVRQDVRDRPERDHDQRERGVGGVETVGPVDDEPDPPIEAFVPGVVDAQSHGRQDAFTPLADRLGRGDEGLQAAALRL
jgi:hypothetical protein